MVLTWQDGVPAPTLEIVTMETADPDEMRGEIWGEGIWKQSYPVLEAFAINDMDGGLVEVELVDAE
jgi:hypothetical protein